MAVIRRSSPGIFGIAVAVALGLLLFVLCVPVCTTACGIAGLAGINAISDLPDTDIAGRPPTSDKTTQQETKHIANESRPGEGFRGIPWGSTMEFVRSHEQGAFIGEQNELQLYKGRLNNLTVIVGYVFVDDKLVRAQYRVNEPHSNSNLYIVDFDGLEKLLRKKYGRPSDSQTAWGDDLYRDDQRNRGLAVSMGHLAEIRTWQTRKSTISLVLTGDNFKVSLVVEYQGKKFKRLEKRKRQAKHLDGL